MIFQILVSQVRVRVFDAGLGFLIRFCRSGDHPMTRCSDVSVDLCVLCGYLSLRPLQLFFALFAVKFFSLQPLSAISALLDF
jgi:hypothetical protein